MQRGNDKVSLIIQEPSDGRMSGDTDLNSLNFSKNSQISSKFFSKTVRDYSNLRAPKISIAGFKFSPELSSKVVVYNLEIFNLNNQNAEPYSIERRFKDFYKLRKNLKKNAGNIPKIPSRTLFKVTKNESLEKRRIVLE